MRVNRSFTALFLLATQLSSCEKSGGDPNPFPRLDRPLELTPLFYYAERTRVEPYTYLDTQAQVFYRIRGDSSIIDIINATVNKNAQLNLLPLDTVSQRPTLRWLPTGNKLVWAGVFEARIETSSLQIINPEAMVWAWNTTLSSENDLTFDKGRAVADGVIQYDQPAVPLSKGNVYYWAAWAWDDKGLYIVKATAEQIFIVQDN
jgi:hypothetical protein